MLERLLQKLLFPQVSMHVAEDSEGGTIYYLDFNWYCCSGSTIQEAVTHLMKVGGRDIVKRIYPEGGKRERRVRFVDQRTDRMHLMRSDSGYQLTGVVYRSYTLDEVRELRDEFARLDPREYLS